MAIERWISPRHDNNNVDPILCDSLSMEMSRLTRDETTEPVSRDQTLRRKRRQGNIHFSLFS